jgi:hypothetical protein
MAGDILALKLMEAVSEFLAEPDDLYWICADGSSVSGSETPAGQQRGRRPWSPPSS